MDLEGVLFAELVLTTLIGVVLINTTLAVFLVAASIKRNLKYVPSFEQEKYANATVVGRVLVIVASAILLITFPVWVVAIDSLANIHSAYYGEHVVQLVVLDILILIMIFATLGWLRSHRGDAKTVKLWKNVVRTPTEPIKTISSELEEVAHISTP